MTPTPTAKRGSPETAKDDMEKKKKPRSTTTHLETPVMKQLLMHHLEEHETFEVGNYLKKTSQKDPASVSEVLDWAPCLLQIVKMMPSGLISPKNLAAAFAEILKERPLTNPFLTKRLGCFRTLVVVIKSAIDRNGKP